MTFIKVERKSRRQRIIIIMIINSRIGASGFVHQTWLRLQGSWFDQTAAKGGKERCSLTQKNKGQFTDVKCQ